MFNFSHGGQLLLVKLTHLCYLQHVVTHHWLHLSVSFNSVGMLISSGWKLMNHACLNKCMIIVLMEGQSPDVLLLYKSIQYRWPCSPDDIATTNHSVKSLGSYFNTIMMCHLWVPNLTIQAQHLYCCVNLTHLNMLFVHMIVLY